MKIRLKFISPSLKILIAPVAIIIGSVVFVFVIFQFGYPRITRQREELGSAKTVERTFEERLSVLREFKKGVLDERTDAVYLIFPNKNPGSYFVSQIKSIALDNKMALTSIETASGAKLGENINTSQVVYEFESEDISGISNFLLGLKNIAPYNVVDEVEISKTKNIYTTKLTSIIFWANLPTKLPELTEPLKDLTQDERNLLVKLEEFKLPKFQELSPQTQPSRLNPFN